MTLFAERPDSTPSGCSRRQSERGRSPRKPRGPCGCPDQGTQEECAHTKGRCMIPVWKQVHCYREKNQSAFISFIHSILNVCLCRDTEVSDCSAPAALTLMAWVWYPSCTSVSCHGNTVDPCYHRSPLKNRVGKLVPFLVSVTDIKNAGRKIFSTL